MIMDDFSRSRNILGSWLNTFWSNLTTGIIWSFYKVIYSTLIFVCSMETTVKIPLLFPSGSWSTNLNSSYYITFFYLCNFFDNLIVKEFNWRYSFVDIFHCWHSTAIVHILPYNRLEVDINNDIIIPSFIGDCVCFKKRFSLHIELAQFTLKFDFYLVKNY